MKQKNNQRQNLLSEGQDNSEAQEARKTVPQNNTVQKSRTIDSEKINKGASSIDQTKQQTEASSLSPSTNQSPRSTTKNQYGIQDHINSDDSSPSALQRWILNQKQDDFGSNKNDQELMKFIFQTQGVDLDNNQINQEKLNASAGVDIVNGDFEIVNKDKNGRIILHRIAMEHRSEQIKHLFNTIEGWSDQDKKDTVNNRDLYHNTPLMLACVYYDGAKKNNRKDVIHELLSNGAEPNTYNPSTFWTPLHWSARYGDIEGIKMLLKSNAHAYMPDKKGNFPIDYAGLFGKVEAVQLLLKHAIATMRTTKQQNGQTLLDSQSNQAPIQNQQRIQPESLTDSLYPSPVLEHNSIYHTSLLYWAALFPEISANQMKIILDEFESYPEGPVAIHNERTPIHAAAQNEDPSKLSMLLQSVRTRYQINSGTDLIRRHNDFKARWIRYFKIKNKYKNLARLKKFNDEVFQKKLQIYGANGNQFSFDLQDAFQNTPLHLASQKGNQACVDQLIQVYYCRLDTRNLEGWMPKDYTQYDEIKKLYRQFYQKLDQEWQAAEVANGPEQEETQRQLQLNRFRQFQVQYKGKQMITREMLNSREWMPTVPQLAIKVSIKNPAVINNMVGWLTEAGFTVQMFSSLVANVYYITLNMDQKRLEQEAKSIQFKMKLDGISEKRAYDPQSRTKYEPFRSKDIQSIMITVLNGLFNTHSLMQKGIIIAIIPMHDYHGNFELQNRFINSGFLPMPFNIIRQMYREGRDLVFTEINAVKNYYGEHIAFHYVWMSFYTAWLLIPGGLGVALTIYQIVSGFSSLISIIYAVIVCLWVTLFMERWKRKVSEVSFHWGIFDFQNQKASSIRSQFRGDEFFSHVTHQVDRRSRSCFGKVLQYLSLPILAGLLALNTYIFFCTIAFKKKYVNGLNKSHDRFFSILAGVLNGIAIQIVNYLYQRMAGFFIEKENLKYTDTHEASFTYKLFIFKFINTNLSLFYSAFAPYWSANIGNVGSEASRAADYTQLYYMLVGMTLQKSATILATKHLIRIIKVWIFKKMYFRTVRKKAAEQNIKHARFMSNLDKQSSSEFGREIEAIRNKPIFKETYQKDGNGVYKRLILNASQKVEEQQVMIDAVEINALMPEKSEQIDINEISELFLLFGFATLYSAVCPIAAFLVMLHNMVDMRLQIVVSYCCVRRPLQQTRANIGPWMQIAEFISLIAVITNCLFLYVALKGSISDFLLEKFNVQSHTTVVWILVAIEHFIIGTKLACIVLIKDYPGWVGKTFRKKETEVKQIMIEEAERDEKERISLLEKEKMMYQQRNLEILKLIRGKLQTTKELLNVERQEKAELLAENEKVKQSTITAQLALKEEKSKAVVKQCKLANFLDIHQEEWMGLQRIQELEIALNRNLQSRLFRQTFNKIEKNVLCRRISKLYATKKQVIINCVECSNQPASVECIQCEDHYCQKCSEEIHTSSHLFSLHSRIQIPLEPIKQFSIFPAQDQSKSQPSSQNQVSLVSQWKKFEYFNFPVQPGSHLGQLIQKHFAFLRKNYIENNYIEGVDKINFLGLFVDEHYELLTDKQAKIMKQKQLKLMGDPKDAPQSQHEQFNDEELFYMNRIAYYLFSHKGDHLTFANFVNRLDILQNGVFHKKLAFWISIIMADTINGSDESSQVVKRGQIWDIFRVSFVQDVNNSMKDQEILDLIFGDKEEIKISQFIDCVNNDTNVKAYMRCILQCSLEDIQF